MWAQGWAQSEPTIGNLTPPYFENFGLKDGLSDEIYSTIGMDSKGFVWAGSASGLYRFDGYRWSSTELAGANSLVRDMLSDSNGHLWAIFEREGLAINRDGHWSLTGDDAFFQRFSTTRFEDGSQRFWLHNTHRILELSAGQWQQTRTPPGDGQVVATLVTQQFGGAPRLWSARSNSGLWTRSLDEPDAPWSAVDTSDLDVALFTDLVVSEHQGLEEVWVLTYGSGILRLRSDGQTQRWRKADGQLPSEAIYSGVVTYDARGERSLWVASRAGLLHFHGDELRIHDRSAGLPSNAVRGIKAFKDPDGSDVLWLATEQGVSRARLSPTAWRTVSRLGESENGIFGVIATTDPAGAERILVASGMDGMAVFDGGEWAHWTARNSDLPSDNIRGIWLTPDARDLGLLALDDGQLMVITQSLELLPLEVPWPTRRQHGASDVSTFEGETWVATLQGGIYRLNDRSLERLHAPASSDPILQAVALQQMGSGDSWLWGAGRDGLVRFNHQERVVLDHTNAMSDVRYRDIEIIALQERTELWTSTERHGLVRYDISDPLNPTRLSNIGIPALPDPTVYSVTADSEGRIYICTNNGVQLLRMQADGSFTERVFRREDGLAHDECNARAQFVDERNRFWAGTLAGLSVYDPSLELPLARTRQPSPLYLKGVAIDGKPVDHDLPDPLIIPAGAETMTVTTTLLSNHRERESLYHIQLDEQGVFASDWSRSPSRTWTRPDPGHYTLRIEAQDFAGVAAAPIEFPVIVESAWFERRWAQLGIAFSLLLSALGLAALYGRRLRQRQSQLEALVDQRTQDLASANRQLVELSFKDPLTGAANRRRLDLAGRDTLARAAQQEHPVSLILLDLDYFKEFNDRHGHLAGDLALKCVAEQLASAMRPGDLIARFGGEEFACLLPNTALGQAEQIAERARAAVNAGSRAELANRFGSLTISAGVACAPRGDAELSELIRQADEALYRAKHQGRNQVVSAREKASSLISQ